MLSLYHFLYLVKKIRKVHGPRDYQLLVIREMIDSVHYLRLYDNEEFKKAMIQTLERYSLVSDFAKSGMPGYDKYI